MLARVAHYVGHRRFLPVLVNLFVAFLASRRTRVMRHCCCLLLLCNLFCAWLPQLSNEKHQLPVVLILHFVRIVPPGHARQSHTILDDASLSSCVRSKRKSGTLGYRLRPTFD
jgi:hypothetical protein